jgi:hypothetical protein
MNTRSGFGIVAVTALLVISGCAVQASSPVSDDEARERFVEVLNETQAVVGGTWSVRDDPTPRGCIIPLWVDGQRFPALRIADAPDPNAHSVDRVEQAWRDDAMAVTRTEVGTVTELKGESATGELYLFRVSGSAMTLSGESECRPTN